MNSNLFLSPTRPRLSSSARTRIRANVMAAWETRYFRQPSQFSVFKWWLVGPSLAIATILFIIVAASRLPGQSPSSDLADLDAVIAEMDQIEF